LPFLNAVSASTFAVVRHVDVLIVEALAVAVSKFGPFLAIGVGISTRQADLAGFRAHGSEELGTVREAIAAVKFYEGAAIRLTILAVGSEFVRRSVCGTWLLSDGSYSRFVGGWSSRRWCIRSLTTITTTARFTTIDKVTSQISLGFGAKTAGFGAVPRHP